MSNYHLRDKGLSYGAVGLLSKAMSFRDDWEYSISGLVSIAKTNKKEVQRLLKELEQNGYLIRERIQNEKGRFEYSYQFLERPRPQNRDTGIHTTDNRDMGAHTTGNRDTEIVPQLNIKELNIKELNINNKEKKEEAVSSSKRTEFDAIIDSFDNEKIQEALRNFIRMRFSSQTGLSTAAFQMLVDQLRELAFTDEERLHIINTAVLNGWKTFKKVENQTKVLKPKNDDEVIVERKKASQEEIIALMKKLREGA